MARYEVRPSDDAPWSSGADIVGVANAPEAKDGVGSESYSGFSMYFPAGFPFALNTLYNIFYEWHGDNNFQASFKLLVNLGNPPSLANARLAATLDYGAGTKVYDIGPVVYGQWIDFVCRLKWSKGADGIAEVWVNGVKKASVPGQNWYASGQTNVKPQLVYYREAHDKTATFYYDGLRIGNSYESVRP